MSLSHRSSPRAADESPRDLLAAANGTNKGADGISPGTPTTRVGRCQLAAVRTSLSDRDCDVLRSIAALHFATTKQLERLHFSSADTQPLAAARATTRALTRLRGLHLLDHLERRIGGVRAGSAAFVWRLAPAGSRLLGHDHRRRSREPSLAHLAHVIEVADLVVRLHEHARSNGAVDLVEVQSEPACWRAFVGMHGARALLKPDLRLTIGRNEIELHWFVELDRGSEHRPALTRKLNAYLGAWRDGGEQARTGVFPRVLWVVPDAQRAHVIRAVWQSLPGVPAGMFTSTTSGQAIEVLTRRGGS
jgi:hypothetical protein